jgi:molecular chaperone DnaK (HSP70)
MVKLVLEQIKATKIKVKSILLVGGFGGSQYLQERIRGAVEQHIEVIKPPYAWSAVVQGALVKGLAYYDTKHATVHLSSRMARKHMGMQIRNLFDRHIHLKSKRSVEGLSTVSNIIHLT